MITYLDDLTRILSHPPTPASLQPSGEWGHTIARAYAADVLAYLTTTGWQPPNVPPAVEAAAPPAASRGRDPH